MLFIQKTASVLFLVLLVFPLPLGAQARLSDSAYADLKGKELYLRKTVNSNRKIYVRSGRSEGYYIHAQSRLFPVKTPYRVKIKDCKPTEQDPGVEIRFQHEHLGNGEIIVYTSSSTVFKEAVAMAFSETEDAEPKIVRVKATGVFHFAGCNHLPPDDALEPVTAADLSDPQSQKCYLCFLRTPLLSNLGLEERLGEGIAGQVHARYAMVMDDAIQRRVRTAGNKVLEKWPLPLKGYRYRYYAVDSDLVNAFACPAGRIYVTSGMLQCMESEEELEAVLAHEIAHVEMRHSYRQFRTMQKGSFWSILAAGVAGLALKNKNWFDVAASIGVLATGIVMAGHSREYESEADSLASIYMAGHSSGDTRGSFATILRKLQYHQDFRDPTFKGEGILATHPEIDKRIHVVENSKVAGFAEADVFNGYNDDGDLVATVSFQVQRAYPGLADEVEGGLQVIALVESTAALGDKSEVKDIKIRSGGQEIKLDNKEDTEIYPDDSVGATFFEKGVRDLVGRIDEIRLDLKNVKKWERAGES